jgi:hypothetical protein
MYFELDEISVADRKILQHGGVGAAPQKGVSPPPPPSKLLF